MKRDVILNKFKGGFSYGHDYKTVELLLDERHTKDDELRLQAYDAALMGLPPVANWNKPAKKELTDAVMRLTKDVNINVYVDDVLIKRKKKCKK